MNWVMDKAALRAGVGRAGDRQGREPHRARHAVQRPARRVRAVRDAGDHGSVAKAKAAMKGSKYDTKGDGTCSALGVQERAAARRRARGRHEAVPVDPGERREDRDHVHRALGRGRLPGAPDDRRRTSRSPSSPAGARTTPTRSRSSTRSSTAARSSRPATRTTRSSGSRPRRAKARPEGQRDRTCPSVDAELDRCAALVGSERGSRATSDLDRKLMTKVVPWVPYLWRSPAHITGPTGDEVGIRPVQRHHGVRARRREVTASCSAGCGAARRPSRSSRRKTRPPKNCLPSRDRRRSTLAGRVGSGANATRRARTCRAPRASRRSPRRRRRA